MTDENTNKLLDNLIINVSALTHSVNDLVAIDRVRVEKDKQQDEKNEEFQNFINDSRPIVTRAKESHAMWDKVKPVILVFILIGLATMAGVNFSK